MFHVDIVIMISNSLSHFIHPLTLPVIAWISLTRHRKLEYISLYTSRLLLTGYVGLYTRYWCGYCQGSGLISLQGLLWINFTKSSPLVYILPLTNIFQRGYFVKFGDKLPLSPLVFWALVTKSQRIIEGTIRVHCSYMFWMCSSCCQSCIIVPSMVL